MEKQKNLAIVLRAIQCPRCESYARHRLLWIYLQDCTSFAKKNDFAMIHGDIRILAFEDNYFDCILCCHVLEHVKNDGKAMKELLRVLKPGAWAIIQVPVDSTRETTFENDEIVIPLAREKIYWHYDHVRLYDRDYADRLRKVGFSVHIDSYVKRLNEDASEKYALCYYEDIYFCTKNE